MRTCKKTPLYEFHERNGHIINFAGFCMPLYYKSIIREHLSVRKNVGLFDVSHMGRFLVSGDNATKFLNFICANDVNKLTPGRAQYTLMLNDHGGIIDDLVIYKITASNYLMVVNAGNIDKDCSWIKNHLEHERWNVEIKNISDNSVMFALQGPNAVKILNKILPDATTLRRFSFLETGYKTANLLVSRTGYTGEDGFEFILFSTDIGKMYDLWNNLRNEISAIDGLVCGLGARDSLRIEAGYCLYGNDINESTNPFEAGLTWIVKMYKSEFIGKRALESIKGKIKKKRVGLIMKSKIVPRPGYRIYLDRDEIGYITSGTFSPILNKGIGMAYIKTQYAEENVDVSVLIRNKYYEGVIKEFPLYNPDKYGYSRSVTS